MELVRLGKIEPIIGARMPLEQLNDALELAQRAEAFGRIMIDVAEPPRDE
jgi:D-arabinose 1-dehydrogenase-like Zn-dependent alcohol dehydrogenase